jgi:precorrin-6Y C5,15-methyltransferase (decarboxylating)
MIVLPAPPTFSLAAARLGWALQAVVTLGLHAARVETLLRYLHPGQRLLLLMANGEAPAQVARLLIQYGFGDSVLFVMEALGGPREAIHRGVARDFIEMTFAPLNIVAVEVRGGSNARRIPYAAGLPDDYFEHDGQITKREIRAVTLSALRPGAGELLWDVGLGCGSVAIEWLLSHPANRAIGFEKSAKRAAIAARNAAALGVPHLDIREGEAPSILKDAAEPDAVFIGGGSSNPGVVSACWEALRPGGRMVCNAVTFAGQAILHECRERWGGQLIRITIEREHALGRQMSWQPAIPVMQWSVVKPWR